MPVNRVNLSFLSHIVLRAVVILNLHIVRSFMRSLRGRSSRNGSQFAALEYIWGLSLAWFCQVQCVEIPMELITNESMGINDKKNCECHRHNPWRKLGAIWWDFPDVKRRVRNTHAHTQKDVTQANRDLRFISSPLHYCLPLTNLYQHIHAFVCWLVIERRLFLDEI